MNNFKKVGLTALAGSLIASSAFAASMSVTGGADISLMNSSNADQGNSFSSGDSLNFSASGELDNGFVITSNVEIDGGTEDDRSVVIAMPEMGTLTFQQSGSTAMGAVDDVTPTANEEAWADVTGATAAPGGTGGDNMFHYSNSSLMDGLKII